MKFQVSLVEKLPKGICKECLTNVTFAFNFRNVIINSNVDLQDRLKYLVNESENQTQTINLQKHKNNAITILKKTLKVDTVDEVTKNASTVSALNTDVTWDVTDNIVDEDSNNCLDMRESLKPFLKLDDARQLRLLKMKHQQKPKIYSCRCGFQTTDRKERRRHRYSHKKMNALIPSKIYKCIHCDFKSTKWSDHNKHKTKHVRIRMCVCNICGKSCRAENLQRHIETHNVELSASCDLCGKMFKNKESMRPHMKVHEGKLYKCDICGVVLKYASAFATHKRKHCEYNYNFSSTAMGAKNDLRNAVILIAVLQIHSIWNRNNLQSNKFRALGGFLTFLFKHFFKNRN